MLLFLARFNNGEDLSVLWKIFHTLGQYIWLCTAKLIQDTLQVVINHGNNIESTIFNIETIDNSIVNINNQYELEAPEGILTEYDERLQREKNNSSYYVQCHRGKLCKGIRGLRAHQRFCTIGDVLKLRELFNAEIETNGDYFNDENFEETTFTPQAKLPTPGLKLPLTTETWDRANEFFKPTLDVNKEITDKDENISHLQDTIDLHNSNKTIQLPIWIKN